MQQVSSDTLPAYATNGTSTEHATEMETDTFSWGDTVVAAFQVGRNGGGYGAQAIGWATSTDDGQTWTNGILPGLTASSPSPNAAYPVVVNQSVAYDADHGAWVIPSVTYVPNGTGKFHEKALLVNTSTDGRTWTAPVTAVSTNVDKAWGVCDNSTTSPYYGTCYVAYSQIDSGDALAVTRSTDGGRTWSTPVNVPSGTAGVPATGYNTNPVVRPDGTVVVVSTDVHNGANGYPLLSTVSTDGGATWSVPVSIATVQYHTPPTASTLRAKNKPSVDVDANGTVYAAWSDCRFHAGCAADDIVYVTSTDGRTWSAPVRVAPDPTTTAEDKFIPGFGVQPGTSGATAHLGAVYYTFQAGSCATTCLLQAQFVSSTNGGRTWSTPYAINPTAVPLSWAGTSYSGGPAMVGDYLSVSFVQGSPVTVVSLPTSAPTAGSPPTFHQSEVALTLPVGWTTPAYTALANDADTQIANGQSITFHGRLTDANGAGIANAPVIFERRLVGTTSWLYPTTFTSDSTGAVTYKLSPSQSYQFRWRYAGTSTYAAVTSSSQTVTVVAANTALSVGNDLAVPAGQSVTLSSTLTNTSAGSPVANQPISLQSRPASGGTFTTVATATTNSSGVGTVTFTPTATAQYQWVFAGVPNRLLASTSGPQTVTVS